MPLPKEQAWFPAKNYGYGWGLPSRWQGWVVFIVFIVGLAVGSLLIRIHPIVYVVYAVLLSAGLTGILMWKGEAPRWREGGVDEP